MLVDSTVRLANCSNLYANDIYRYVYQIAIGRKEYNTMCSNDSIHATRHVKLSVNR